MDIKKNKRAFASNNQHGRSLNYIATIFGIERITIHFLTGFVRIPAWKFHETIIHATSVRRSPLCTDVASDHLNLGKPD